MFYTRKGDSGTSGLYNCSERWPKNSPVFEALGTLDELNSLLGVARACALHGGKRRVVIAREILRVQEALFVIQAEVARADKKITGEEISRVEKIIDKIEAEVGNPHGFVISGASELSALLDYARAVSRKTERRVLSIPDWKVSSSTQAYLNRLSSLLYALARYAVKLEKRKELSPSY